MNANMLQNTERSPKRVEFDFEIEFSNGGGIHGHNFRLDIEGDDITDRDLADYLVRDLRLLMVGRVRILRKQIIAEPHKRQKPAAGAPGAGRYIDLSHDIEDGMVTYKGIPAPVIRDFLTREASRKNYATGTEFHIGSISMVANTGTYLDTAFHRYARGDDLSALPLDRVADVDAVVVKALDGRAIGVEHLNGIPVERKAVLIRTGWDAHWRTERYFTDSPYLTADAARALVDRGAVVVGIDSLNIDDTSDATRPAHSLLLGANIPIVEHLCNLAMLPSSRFRFFAVPVKVKGMGTFPVRAFAIVDT